MMRKKLHSHNIKNRKKICFNRTYVWSRRSEREFFSCLNVQFFFFIKKKEKNSRVGRYETELEISLMIGWATMCAHFVRNLMPLMWMAPFSKILTQINDSFYKEFFLLVFMFCVASLHTKYGTYIAWSKYRKVSLLYRKRIKSFNLHFIIQGLNICFCIWKVRKILYLNISLN